MKLCLFLVAVITLTSAADGDYTYDDQTSWGGECGTSLRQSPIDIDHVEKTVYYSTKIESFGGDVEITRKTDKKMQFDITDSANTIIHMPDNWPVGHTKGLQAIQLHIHWGPQDGQGGSEHTLFGDRYAGEAHLVTRNLDEDDETASHYLAVFGIFLEVGQPVDEEVADDLKGLVTGSKTVLSLDKLYNPHKTKSIFTYDGGLTTPDCHGVVFWQVLENHVKVPESLINSMRAEGGIDRNNRNIQELNGRQITHRLVDQLYSSPEGESETCKLNCRAAQETCMWSLSRSTAAIPSLLLLFVTLGIYLG